MFSLPVVLSKNPVKFAGEQSGLEKFFKLEHWKVQHEKRRVEDRIVWKRGGFVLVVAITENQEVVLIREYKNAAGLIFHCLPAGGQNKGETPAEAALRELKEETGYIGCINHCRVFGPFFNIPDKSTEQHNIVVVTDVQKGLAEPEESEKIVSVEICCWPIAKKKLLILTHYAAMDIAYRFLSKT
ncbi:MAG: NUDIX hydrolase [Candidatus Staskawiczbacteria bacterium]|nr:NUDIX hydrolase [Candidatus Staskawiczbacteria bacterium]